MKDRVERQLVRLPEDVREFLRAQAERYCSSLNSEIVRSVRQRMEAGQGSVEGIGER